MDTELQIFGSREFGRLRTAEINGEAWFVGKDVAQALGYSNPRDALSRHVDIEDKGVVKHDTLGGGQQITVINESGLYSLVLSSKLPGARRFKHWVTSEVLPSIHRTGSYQQPMLDMKMVSAIITQTATAVCTEMAKQLMPLLLGTGEGMTLTDPPQKPYRRNRNRSTISKLEPSLRRFIDEMCLDRNYTYQEIKDVLVEEGIQISITAIAEYAQRLSRERMK